MTLDELNEAVDAIVIGPEDVAELQQRVREAEVEFEREAKARRVNAEWLNMECTI